METGKDIKKELSTVGRSVAWLSRQTNIPATTLRSCISRDADITVRNAKAIQEAIVQAKEECKE